MTTPIEPKELNPVIDVIQAYTNGMVALSVWGHEIEHKLMWGNLKEYSRTESIQRIADELGIRVTWDTAWTLRGAKLIINVELWLSKTE